MTMSAKKNANETTSKRARRANSDAPADAQLLNAPPADMDAMRYELARRINRFVADRRRAWRTCKEPACRRHRYCRAPHIHCSNAPPPRPDPDGRRVARTMARVARALRELHVRQGEKG